MSYIGIEKPSWYKSNNEMTINEAEMYYKWYISKIDERIQYLQDYIKNDGCSLELDFSPESLKPLWVWYIEKISIENKTKEELEIDYKRFPEFPESFIDKWKLTKETENMIFDIGMYFGEVLRKNNSELLQWNIIKSPKKSFWYKKIVLSGIAKEFIEPEFDILVRTKSFIGNRFDDLFDAYTVWSSTKMKY